MELKAGKPLVLQLRGARKGDVLILKTSPPREPFQSLILSRENHSTDANGIAFGAAFALFLMYWLVVWRSRKSLALPEASILLAFAFSQMITSMQFQGLGPSRFAVVFASLLAPGSLALWYLIFRKKLDTFQTSRWTKIMLGSVIVLGGIAVLNDTLLLIVMFLASIGAVCLCLHCVPHLEETILS